MINYIFIGVAVAGLLWEAYDILTFKKKNIANEDLGARFKSVYISRNLWAMLVFLLLFLRSISKVVS